MLARNPPPTFDHLRQTYDQAGPDQGMGKIMASTLADGWWSGIGVYRGDPSGTETPWDCYYRLNFISRDLTAHDHRPRRRLRPTLEVVPADTRDLSIGRKYDANCGSSPGWIETIYDDSDAHG